MTTTTHPMADKPVGQLLRQFAVPSIIAMLVSSLYNIIDQLFIGQSIGLLGNAATNIAFPLTPTCVAFSLMFGIGGGARFYLAMGAGRKKEAAAYMGNALLMLVSCGIVLCIIVRLFLTPMLLLFGATDQVLDYARTYTGITSLGFPFLILATGGGHLIRADGSPNFSMVCNITGAVINTILDALFIFKFDMGMAGAAWATVISQGISGILCLVYIVKAVPILHLHKEDWRPSGHLLKIQLAVGIPMALQYSITAIGTMMVQTALNLLGSTQVAAFTAANKIEQIVTQAYVAMGTTMATYCAQNIGAGKIKRIRQGFKSITIMGSIYSVVVAAIIMTVGKYMTYLFLSGDLTEIMHSVDIYLKCVGTFFIPLTVVNVYRNGIQGMGYGLLPMMAGVAELVGRGVVAMIAAGQKSYFGVCMASPAAWILASALLIVMYYYVIRQNEKRFAKYADEE